MRTRSLVVAPLLAVAGLVSSWSTPTPAPAPIPGPGAVLTAARQVFTAIETGDRDALLAAIVSNERSGGVALRADQEGKLAHGGEAPALVFLDLGPDGRPVVADTPEGAAKALLAAFAGGDVAVEHRIVAAAADCPAAGCSWGAVDFERTLRRGDEVEVAPMRVTLLTRHVDGRMRVFAWHASAR
ncbi:MAG: hypothetical protein AB7O97_16545 [Planctomycetota bacterium]